MMRRMSGVAAAAVLVAMPIGMARADAIDGNWCSREGKSMSISGPDIVTPGGTRMKGDYDRHGFRYVVPAAEKPAGAQVDMSLVNEETLHVRTGNGPVVTWRRCKPTS